MSFVNKPNFFIVGAPKCGTTALFTYLAGHPNIGMSWQKEPHFFAPESFGQDRSSGTLADYLGNFDHAIRKTRIGEASTGYLASPETPQKIQQFNPSAQIIVMLRNPIDVLHALHSELVYAGAEHITRFEQALDSREVRHWQLGPRRGEPVIRPGYRETTNFSEHIQRYFDTFGRDRVHVIWFGDFANSPGLAYERVLSFLGLSSDGRHEFEPINANKRVRCRAVQRWIARLSNGLGGLKRSFPTLRRGARSVVARLNLVHEVRPAIEAGFRRQLELEYAPELRKLERLLGRTLT